MSTTLKSTASDAEINAAVAERICGWHQVKIAKKIPHYAPEEWGWADKDGKIICGNFQTPQYATDANAVIGLMENYRYRVASVPISGDRPWYRSCIVEIFQYGEHKAYEATFCRAACFALLRANGVTIEDSP